MPKSLMESERATARKKGLAAAGTAIGSVALLVIDWPILGAIGLAGAGYLTWDWFRFRAKRGLRF